MSQKANKHFEKAENHLKDANQELYKPMEDVVSFLVCKNSLFAIENHLKGYLVQRGFETNNEETLDDLLNRCKSLNKKFNQIKIDTIDCSSDRTKNKYCDDINKVSSCFEAANSLENFLKKQNVI